MAGRRDNGEQKASPGVWLVGLLLALLPRGR